MKVFDKKFFKIGDLLVKASVMLFLIFLPMYSVQAQELKKQCQCFCETKQGSKPPGNGLEFMIPSECKEACKKKNQKVSVCAYDIYQYPDSNVSCFTQDQCTKTVKNYCGEFSGDAYASIKCAKDAMVSSFDAYQPPECMPGSHYCYAPSGSTTVRLNVKLGEVIEVQDFQKYLSVAYKWLVSGGVVIAILLVMVGGFQYVLGAASSDQVQKGKERIRNAVIGLVLLISAITVIETINPRLSRIAVPRIPLIKTKEIGSTGKSCEQFVKDDYKVAWHRPGTGQDVLTSFTGANSPGCGNAGIVQNAPDGAEMTSGTTCNFKQCEGEQAIGDQTKRCVGSGKTASCLTCGQIYQGSPDTAGKGVLPSASVCGEFTKGITQGTAEQPDRIESCLWTKDRQFNQGIILVQSIQDGACAYMNMDCKAIRASGKCREYAFVELTNRASPTGLYKMVGFELFSEFSKYLYYADEEPDGCVTGCSNFSYKSICEQNPCRIPSGCEWTDSYTDQGIALTSCSNREKPPSFSGKEEPPPVGGKVEF